MSIKKVSIIGSLILILILCLSFYFTNSLAYIHCEKPQISIVEEQSPKITSTEEKITLLSKYIKSRKSSTPQEVADKIAYEIITQCEANYIADDIVVGIIEIESMWNVYANSKANAKGLMQILIEDGVEILPEKAYDISYNIEKGIAIFKSKLKKANGNMSLALKYYVGGDKNYHKEVYKYLGMYTLHKINSSQIEISKLINITKG